MSSSSLSTADIVGIAIGGVLGIATIIGLAFTAYAMFCRKNQPQQIHPQYNQYPPHQQGGHPYGQQMNTGYYQPYQQQQQWNKPPGAYESAPPSYSAVNPGGNSYGKY